jgi:hypothetical protein
MKPTLKSIDQQRGYSGVRNSAGGSGANAVQRYIQEEARISPWLPVAIGAFAVLVVAKAVAENDRNRRYSQSHWLSRLEDRWNDWWPEIRNTADEAATRASRAGNWLYDRAPSRSWFSEIFSRDSDWLPDMKASKRQLLANFDWNNPPRWLRNVDLSTGRKRRQFLRDLRRYGARKSDEIAGSLGWR